MSRDEVRQQVGVQTYNGKNSEDYKVELERFTRTLSGREWEVITGEWTRPDNPAEDLEEEEQVVVRKQQRRWDRADAAALQYIPCTLNEDKRSSIRLCEHAADAWKQLS